MAYFRKITLLLTTILLASCVQEEEYTTLTGVLQCPDIEVSHEVDDMVNTRATVDLPNVPSDVIANTEFVITDALGRTHEQTGTGWNLELPVGDYTIEATYGSNTFSAPHFTATHSGTITAGTQPQTPSLSLSLANSLVRVTIADDLADHFTPTGIKFSDGTTTKEETYDENWHYVPSGKSINITLPGTNSVGNAAEYKYTISPKAGLASSVTCQKDGTNWPTITLPEQQDGAWNTRLYITPATVDNMSAANQDKLVYELSASNDDWSNPVTAEHISGDYYVVKGLTNGSTYYLRARIGKITSVAKQFTVQQELSGTTINATHYNDGSGHLAGTNATVSLGLTGILKTLNDAGLLVFDGFSLSNGSVTVRSASTESAVMSATEGWPYLPQGSVYVLTGNHKIKGESTTVSFTKSGLSVPAPTFTVSVGASYSSYDKYLANDITAANNSNAETIYGVSASWGISNDLLSNSNYTKSMKMYLSDTEKASQTPTTNSYTLGNITGLTTWQAYTLKASVIFDGKTVEATKTHHITGLPYTAAPPTNSGNHPWTSNYQVGLNNINFNSDNVDMDGISRAPKITSPKFYIPSSSNINVTVSSKAKVDAYSYWLFGTQWQTTKYIATIGGTNVFSQESGKETGTTFNLSGNGTFTSSSNTLDCASSCSTTGPKIVIYSVSILYIQSL